MNAASDDRFVRSIGVDGCLLVEIEHSGGANAQHGSVDSPTLVITLAGAVAEPARPGRQPALGCVFLPAGTSSVARVASQGWRVLVAELHGSWALELLRGPRLAASQWISNGWTQRLIRRLHQELLDADSATPAVLRSLVILIVSEIARSADSPREERPIWLETVRALIELNFRAEVGVRELARSARVHPAHLSKAFSRAFGSTVREYVRALRVDFARRQMESTDLTLSEIAVSAGFADQSHFTKAFKRVFRKSPSKYRQALSAPPQD